MYEQNVLLRSYKSFKHTFNHALLESKISGTMFFAQWWVLDLTSEPLSKITSTCANIAISTVVTAYTRRHDHACGGARARYT